MQKRFGSVLLMTMIILGGCAMNNNDQSQQNEKNAGAASNVIPGEVGVGFEKGVTEDQAKAVLEKYGLPYEKTIKINAGKAFFYNTGLKYLIKVPEGHEAEWVEKLRQDKEIKMVVFNFDANKVDVD